MAVLIPKESFERITEKIVRGVYFIEDGLFIEPPYAIDFYALPEEGDAQASLCAALSRTTTVCALCSRSPFGAVQNLRVGYSDWRVTLRAAAGFSDRSDFSTMLADAGSNGSRQSPTFRRKPCSSLP
jgi:hypothetical protein